jgi:hypothetical protein
MRRIPIESAAPIQVFAAARLAVAIVALLAVTFVGFPYEGRAAAVLVVFVLWAAALLAVARREPERVLNPGVAAVDFGLLLALELVAPDTLGGVRLAALFLVAAHAHFQGEQRGLMIAACGSSALIVGSPSTRPSSCSRRSPRRSSSAFCARPSRRRACAPAGCRGARCRPRARCAGAWRTRSTTAPYRS